MDVLGRLVKRVRACKGIRRKKGIRDILRSFRAVSDFGRTVLGPGDDAGAIRDQDGYLLFSADGMMPGFLEKNPFRAGMASVLVNVNDIYAMGGRPLGMVNILGGGSRRQRSQAIRGMTKACRLFQVPMLGGHFHPEGEFSLSVAVLGRAKTLLRGDTARPGDCIIAAIDLQGREWKGVNGWDAFSRRRPIDLQKRLSALPLIAEKGLAGTCRDISTAGIAGTIGLILGSSGCGGEIILNDIPIPPRMDLHTWITAYPSYGFILTAPLDNARKIIGIFQKRGIAASMVGRAGKDKKVLVRLRTDHAVLWDFSRERLL